MLYLIDIWETVRGFISTGGDLLWIVFGVLAIMWILMIERYWFMLIEFPSIRKNIIERWDSREDTTSWYAHRVRDAWISEASELLNARILLIKTLVAVCPLIGLFGTVTGMISVFEVMAVSGTGNPRLMASGISMATIPTMAGMVAALSGVFFSSRIETRVRVEVEKLVDSLPHH